MIEQKKHTIQKTVIVIGGGAAGMLAAGRAAERGARVLLLEKTGQLGQKLLVSGKTRCNLTNNKSLKEFIAMYGPNGRFLYGAFERFFREDLLALLKRYGVETKVERGGRIFPASDDARDVAAALRRCLDDHRVEIRTGVRVTQIIVEKLRIAGVKCKTGSASAVFLPADAVILATGGASWPDTGSTGDGYAMAAALGHTIVPLRPALVPLIVEETALAGSMQGVSLRNVRLTAFRCRADAINDEKAPVIDAGRGIPGKRPRPPVIESRLGEMMLTHFGIGGPVTLLMSLSIVEALAEGPVSVAIDLKPALERRQLRDRLQRDFDQYGKRGYRRILDGLLPRKMVEPFIQMTGIPGDKPAHQITSAERDMIAGFLKSLRFSIRAPLPISSAIVTAGGVSLDEIDPRTMVSRLIRGLYFCGEVIDIDADTGGYNLQAAFSTGFLAGENAGN
ncbi:MAG: NAD(P)/FAD-dependent oxidoreductase [Syntrophus sp. (in: bacteria)]|nr:NAD(P)/FAD-dependent oxidoreductase [Syntrophus sp. (in: bacteria)]